MLIKNLNNKLDKILKLSYDKVTAHLTIQLQICFVGASDSSSQADAQSSPNYIFVSNNSQSCPPLVGERLLTTMKHGQSFEGLVVNLACRGDYNAFPNQVKCRRRQAFGESSDLEWSHIPVCYPSVLVSKTHWAKTLHARSVSCKCS